MREPLSTWLRRQLAGGEEVVAVSIAEALGSTPRECDALLLVTKNEVHGTVGGGTIEWTAIERAREMMSAHISADRISMPLGPLSGQCCGGHMTLDLRAADEKFASVLTERETAAAALAPRLFLFGAGHVGRAIARAVSPLPVRLTVIDTRPEEIALLPGDIDRLIVEDPAALVACVEPRTSHVILTHSHTLDFLIAEAALVRGDTPYVGMIGSATKRARFRSWANQRGLDRRSLERLVCPIGGDRLRDKRPEVIAALFAAEFISRVLNAGLAGQRNSASQRRTA